MSIKKRISWLGWTIVLGALIFPTGGCKKASHSHYIPTARITPPYFSPLNSSELPLLSMPGELTLDSSGDYLLINQPYLGRVLEVDLKTDLTRLVTTTAEAPWGITPVPKSDRLLVTDQMNPDLVLINPDTGMERSILVPHRGTPFTSSVSADGNWGIVLYAEGYLVRVPLNGGATELIDPVLEDPWGMALEAGDRTVLVCEKTPGRIVRVDLILNTIQTISNSLNKPTDLITIAGGTAALVICDQGEIHQVDLTTGATTLRTTLPGADTITPGRRADEVLIADFNHGKVYTLDLVTNQAVILVEGLSEPTWLKTATPSSLVLIDQNYMGGLYRIDIDQDQARAVVLLEDGSDLLSLETMPDGKRAITTTDAGDLIEVPLNGAAPQTLVTGLINATGLCAATTPNRIYLSERQSTPTGDFSNLAELDLTTAKLTMLTGFSLTLQIHDISRGDATRLVIRDEYGVILYDLANKTLSPFYNLHSPATTGLAVAWPHFWTGWHNNQTEMKYEILQASTTRFGIKTVASGYGLQPVGMTLSRDGLDLYVADLTTASLVVFIP